MAPLHVPAWAWAATIAAVIALVGADLFVSSRRTRPARMAEAAWWTLATVILAVAFGALLAISSGGAAAGQFFAGWLTEYSLSLDNLLVFIILVSRSNVPRQLQGRVVLAGILFALVLRGVVIALGAAALHKYEWVEYLFGAFLIYTAAELAARRRLGDTGAALPPTGPAPPGPPPAGHPSPAARPLPAAAGGGGARLAARLGRRGRLSPVLLLVIVLGVTDVLFALDSIPAIFGLTRDPYLVFTANVFALLGLRHLYFLAGGLLTRLVYLLSRAGSHPVVHRAQAHRPGAARGRGDPARPGARPRRQRVAVPGDRRRGTGRDRRGQRHHHQAPQRAAGPGGPPGRRP